MKVKQKQEDTKPDVKSPKEQNEKPNYSCEVCFKIFQFRGSYTDHLKTHANTDVRHECSECPCFFKNRGHLKSHIKEVHRSLTRIYKCSQCSKKFDSRVLYTVHKRKEHTQTTPYKCMFCNHVYASKNSLKWHIHINHNKDFKKSKCPYCPSEFKWPHHLRVHIKKSHIEQGFTPTDLLKKGLTSIRRKSNNCIVCDAKFEKKLELMLHLRSVHKQELDIYKCCRCEAVFNLKTSLRNHIIDHKRRKDGYKHECEQCHPEINPKLYSQEKEIDFPTTDNRTDIQKEITDFELTLMEDEDIRCMIRFRLKHMRRRRRRTNQSVFIKPDVEPENIVVEPTFHEDGKFEVSSVDGDGDGVKRQIQVCLERVSVDVHKCSLCHCSFSLSDTLGEHMRLSHSSPPATPHKNETVTRCSEKYVENVQKHETTPRNTEKDVTSPKNNDKNNSPKSNEKDVRSPKNSENLDVASKSDQTTKKDGKNLTSPKKNKVYTCHICMEKFIMPLQLGRHIRLTHNRFKCKLCKSSFTNAKISSHKCIGHLNESPKARPNASNVKMVSPKRPRRKSSPEECGKCALFFSTRLELFRHISDVHMPSGKGGKGKDDVFYCDKCNGKFLSRDEIIVHLEKCEADK